jgi:hypothetical protein
MSDNGETNSAPENVLDFEPEAPTPFESVPEAPKTLTERVSEALEEIEVTSEQLAALLNDLSSEFSDIENKSQLTPEIRLCMLAYDGMRSNLESMFSL